MHGTCRHSHVHAWARAHLLLLLLLVNLLVGQLLLDAARGVGGVGVVLAVPLRVVLQLVGQHGRDPAPFVARVALHPGVLGRGGGDVGLVGLMRLRLVTVLEGGHAYNQWPDFERSCEENMVMYGARPDASG